MTKDVRNSIGLFMGEISENMGHKTVYGFDHRYLGEYNPNTDTTIDYIHSRIYGSGDLCTVMIYEYAHEHGRR